MPVPSTEVELNTDYEIVARIWNGSTSAPAIQMPVRFSYFSRGACFVTELFGERPSPIGEMMVDLPVNGAPGHPAIARMPWRTPAQSGLYPIKVELIWSDDANPNNNVGYHGLIVVPLNSPHAHFAFPVRNNGVRARTLHFEADAYTIPPRPRYDPDERAQTPELTAAEVAAHQKEAATIHDRRKFPVPPGWRVEIAPAEVELGPEKDQQITVDITAPDGFRGRQHINIHAFDEKQNPVGGISLVMEG